MADLAQAAALITAGVGTAFGAAGQYQAGKQAQAIGAVNASSIERTTEINANLTETTTAENVGILEYNSRAAEAQAADAIVRGAEQEKIFRTGIHGLIGQQRVAFAAQGVEIGSGSSLDVQESTAQQGELDALTIRTDAAREAWGFRVNAEDIRNQIEALKKTGSLQARSIRATGAANSLSSRMGGDSAAASGTFGAASTILTGAASTLYSKYGFSKK